VTGAELPMICALSPEALAERLEEWAAVEREGLVSSGREPGGRVLRFRPDPALRRELERLVAAEAECCPTLGLRLDEEPGALVLRVSA
jgi:hypothetical protein